MTKPIYIEAQDAFLFACNTSALYSHQCNMARQGKTLNAWINHVKWNVMRHYRNDVNTETVGDEWAISAATAKEVAALLKSYYEKHVKEG